MPLTLFRWPIREVAAAVLVLISSLFSAQGFYDVSARRLEIAPKDCTSLKYPSAIGTCMFNLKCKEKLGIVIGACVDRFLFGACCHFPVPSSPVQNVTLPGQGLLPEAPQLGPSVADLDDLPPTTIESVPLKLPAEPDADFPAPRLPQASPSLQRPHANLPVPTPPAMPSSLYDTTLLPVPLESVQGGGAHNAVSSGGTLPNKPHIHSGLFLPLEHTTLIGDMGLKGSGGDIWRETESTTEEPPRFSTFMYVDNVGSSDRFETTAYPSTGTVLDDPMTTQMSHILSNQGSHTIGNPGFHTSENQGPPTLGGNGPPGTLWSIVHQLVPFPSQQSPGPEMPLNSDELYTVLSASDPVGSIMENRIQVIPPPEPSPEFWKLSTENSVSDTRKPQRPTNRPWASSTYQIHTFKYPPSGDLTTPFPASGLVTWHGVSEETHSTKVTSQTTQKSTTEMPTPSTSAQTRKTTPATTTTSPPKLSSVQNVATTVTFLVRSTTKPVAEVTNAPPSTTTTTTTTTEKPTTTTVPTTLPPKKRTTPKPEVTTQMAPKPKVTTTTASPPKKPDIIPQAGILQSDFDSNIDDFVNQVVQNLAGSLDNLDLDEVILHSPLPSTSPASVSSGHVKDDAPPTLHPLHVLSDPLFPPFPVIGQIPLVKPPKPPVKRVTTTSTTTARPLDYRRDCGVRSLTKQGRIVGGSPSKFGKWPWQALVREATWLGLFSKNKCGGVLISPKYVLTAAHCQPGFLATLTVVLGDFDISSETEGAAGQSSKNSNSVTKNVRRVIVHRDYNAQTFENDIALLELESPVEFQAHIVPICLPMDNEVNVGQQAFVTGWGRLKYGGGVPNMLYEVDVPILNNTDCQNMFLKSGHIKAIRDSFICAGYANGAKDSCEGDSGGPLAMIRPNGQWMLAGTVSHGIKCAYPNLPGVYMRMTYYKPWIKRVTGITTVD